MTHRELRRAVYAKLTPPERVAMEKGFGRLEVAGYEAAERTTVLAQAARLAAPGEPVRARAADRLATAWRRYLASRWTVDQYAAPPDQIETLQHALHRLTAYWRGTALEPDTISRFLRDCYDTDRMK